MANDSEKDIHYTWLDRDDGEYTRRNSQRLDVPSLDDELCKKLFRFTYEERIARAIGLSDLIQFQENSTHTFSWKAVDA